MTTIAEAVDAEDVREDKLFHAAEQIKRAKCLPQETKDALIKHISNARAKHPKVEPTPDKADSPIADTRPSKFAAATASVAKSVKGSK